MKSKSDKSKFLIQIKASFRIIFVKFFNWSSLIVLFKFKKFFLFISTKTSFLAPLEIASIPIEPDPAKRSKQLVPEISNWSQSNKISFNLLVVGLRLWLFSNTIFLPFYFLIFPQQLLWPY